MPRAKGQKMTAEQRATVSQRTREAMQSPEVRDKVKWDDARRAKRAAFWADPANRAKHARRVREGMQKRKTP